MSKLKKLIAGAVLGTSAFACAVATTVKAADETNYGSYVVSNSGATATWDFTVNGPTSNQYYKNGNSILGIVNTSATQLTYKAETTKTLSVPKTASGVSANIHIPVPASSSGTITITGSSSDADRILTLMDSTGTATTRQIVYSSSGNSLTFTSDDITTYNEKTYLRFDSIQTGGDFKIKTIVVNLTAGEYEATAVLHTVTVKDQNGNTISTDPAVADGSTISKVTKVWGYNQTSTYYEDQECETEYTGTITADKTLYVNLVAWDSSKIANEYVLDSSLVSELNGVNGLGNELELTGTIYTLLSDCSYTTSNSNPCVSTTGAVDKTKRGIKFTAPADGIITVSLTSGGTTARDAKLINDSGTAITAASGNVVWNNTEAAAYEVRTLTYNVEEGETYYFGGTNAMRVFSIGFEAQESNTPTVIQQTSADGTAVRFYSVITADVTSIESIGFTLSNGTDEATIYVTSVYQTLNAGYEADSIVAADGQFIAAVYVTEIPEGITVSFVSMVITYNNGADAVVVNAL